MNSWRDQVTKCCTVRQRTAPLQPASQRAPVADMQQQQQSSKPPRSLRYRRFRSSSGAPNTPIDEISCSSNYSCRRLQRRIKPNVSQLEQDDAKLERLVLLTYRRRRRSRHYHLRTRNLTKTHVVADAAMQNLNELTNIIETQHCVRCGCCLLISTTVT